MKIKIRRTPERAQIWKIIILFKGILLIGNGIFCLLFFQSIFKSILHNKLTIQEGSPAYDNWKKPSIPTKLKIYFFNVNNPKEVEDGKKPALTQIGPFTYKEETERLEDIFHDNGTVSYKTRKVWYFLEDESLDLDTIISTIDIPVVAGAEFARGSWFNEMSIAAGFDYAFKESVFINKTARELLFDGYEDPLMTMGSLFAKKGDIPKDKFGWFYKRNGTTWSDGVVNMATGAADFEDVGNIKLWHGRNRTMYPDKCGELRGTSAGFTYPKPDKQFIEYFSTDICRSVRFEKTNSVDVEGINATMYSLLPQNTFGNSETNSANYCYHANFPSGMHNTTGCKDGDTTLKTFVSLPHFLGADPFYQAQFSEGSMAPDPRKHSASISIQPETSIPVQVLMRLQIIIQLRSNPTIGTFLSDLPELFLPVFWFEAEAAVTPDLASKINMITMIPKAAEVIGISSLFVGLCFLGLFLWMHYVRQNNRNKSKSLEKDQKEDEKISRKL